jgi:serine/threonine protein kinase
MGNCCQATEQVPLSAGLVTIPDHLESKSINIRSFTLITVLGSGSFGKVLLMEKKDTRKLYAIKTVLKQKLYNSKKKRNAVFERNVLAQITSPFVVKLHYAFQNSEKLYLVLDFMQGGDLYYHITQHKYFTEEMVRFYAAEIVMALEDLHQNNIVYRDLKPENILMDASGHIKLIDFNLAKSIEGEEKSSSMCGTPEYISPEILKGAPHGCEVDFWSLGCIIYEMIEGKSPFYASTYKSLNSKISNGLFQFTEKFSCRAMDLISQLLVVEVRERLTSMEKVKANLFFKEIDWEEARGRRLEPPIIPEVTHERDTRYFRAPSAIDSSPRPNLTLMQRESAMFQGFTYEESLEIIK